MLVLQKIWRPFFSCYLRLEIRPFALLLMNSNMNIYAHELIHLHHNNIHKVDTTTSYNINKYQKDFVQTEVLSEEYLRKGNKNI